MLAGLGLGARLVARNQQKCGVHDSRSVQHGRHENVVAGAIHEAYMPAELELNPTDGIDKGVGVVAAPGGVAALQAQRVLAHLPLLHRGSRLAALVDLRVGIAKLDCNVSLQLVLEPNRLHPGDCLHHCRLAVGHVPNCAHVDGSLPGDD